MDLVSNYLYDRFVTRKVALYYVMINIISTNPIHAQSMNGAVYADFDLIMGNIVAYVPHEQENITQVNDKV